MFKLIVTVVALLAGQPYGDPVRYEHRDRFESAKVCEAVWAASGPKLSAAIAEQLHGPEGEAFRIEHECVRDTTVSELDIDAAYDELQATLRAMNLAGGLAGVAR